MSDWEYVQVLLDIIDRQNKIIEAQARALAMNQINIEGMDASTDASGVVQCTT